MKCVHFAVYIVCEKLILTCTAIEHTSIMSTKLEIMTISIKTKVVFKFEASQMMCV